ncbi:MFS transporter [Paracoccus pantotrophus]|uniref:MFS transporter n=1 Tax=Paracoccus pantotrophus TaxID=82367 RepID=UPI000491873E|nr:MFS transporter [Paracoccus pantotrophus]
METFKPLLRPMFLALWFCCVLSFFAVWMQLAAAAWHMTTLTDDADMVALVQSATAVPVLLLSLPAGAVADLWSRRNTLFFSYCMMFAATLGLALLGWGGLVTPVILLTLTVLVHSGSAVRLPVLHASLGDFVPESEISAAVALNTVAANGSRAIGPAIAGILLVWLDTPTTFLIAAFFHLPMLGVLAVWKPAQPGARAHSGFSRAMLDGFIYVAGSSPLRVVMLRSCAFTLFGTAVFSLLPLLARQDLGHDAGTYGLLFGMLGVGAFLGALLMAPLRNRMGTAAFLAVGTVAMGLPHLLVPYFTNFWIVVPAFVLGGGAWSSVLSVNVVAAQLLATPALKARVMAIAFMATFGGIAFGGWIWGVVTQHFGTGPAMQIAGLGLLIVAGLGYVLRQADAD